MNNLIKKINTIHNINININKTFVDLDKIIDIIIGMEQNFLLINDIKEFNDKQKVILTIFINKYVHLYPIVSVSNMYMKTLKKNIHPLNYVNIFRGFFIATNIIKSCNCKILSNNILQVGILPTFIEAISKLTPINTDSVRLDFIKIKPTNNKSNIDIYDELISKFKIRYNLIDNLTNLYSMDMNDIKSQIDIKYDLIIFDTYKNISENYLSNIQSNINQRLLTAILDSRYILFQIILGLNILNPKGDLILLFPGSNNIIYQQIITILATVFEEIQLINLEIDYSYRYFVCAKNYTPISAVINQLDKLSNINLINTDKILISILR